MERGTIVVCVVLTQFAPNLDVNVIVAPATAVTVAPAFKTLTVTILEPLTVAEPLFELKVNSSVSL